MGIGGEEVDEKDILEECICVQMRLYMYVHFDRIKLHQF